MATLTEDQWRQMFRESEQKTSTLLYILSAAVGLLVVAMIVVGIMASRKTKEAKSQCDKISTQVDASLGKMADAFRRVETSGLMQKGFDAVARRLTKVIETTSSLSKRKVNRR